jgi:MFS family permease
LQVVLSCLSIFVLWYNSRPRFIAFTILYGIYSGGYNALLPTTIAEIYGVQNYAAVNGTIYFIRGLGVMFGSPIAGLILGSHRRGPSVQGALSALEKNYEHVTMYAGALLLGASVCVTYVRWMDARNKGGWFWKA